MRLTLLALSLVACAPEEQADPLPAESAPPPAIAAVHRTAFWQGFAAGHVRSLTIGGDNAVVALTHSRATWTIVLDIAGDTIWPHWTSTVGPTTHYADLAVGHTDATGFDRVLTVTEAGFVEIHDPATRALLTSFQTGLADVRSVAVGDTNGDGVDEIAVSAGSNFSPSGVEVWTALGVRTFRDTSAGGTSVVLGAFDADPGAELVAASGKVFDLATGAVQLAPGAEFGSTLDRADFNGDGIDDLIAMKEWTSTDGWNLNAGWLEWSILRFDNGEITVGDTNGDGVDELLLGDDQWGDVIAYDLSTRAELWSVANPRSGVSGIVITDLDDDGSTEVVFANGASSSGEDALSAIDPAAGAIFAESIDLVGPFLGPYYGDLDGDGDLEGIIAPIESESGYGGARIVAYDPATFAVIGVSDEFGAPSVSAYGVKAMALGDIDADGLPEVVLAGDHIYDGRWESWSMDSTGTFTNETTFTNPASDGYTALALADVSNDGTLDVVVAADTFVYGYSAAGALLWTSPQSLGGCDRMVAGDIDADGTPELAALSAAGSLFVFNLATNALEAQLLGAHRHIAVTANPAGGAPNVALVDGAGVVNVHRFLGGAWTVTHTVSIGQGVDHVVPAAPNNLFYVDNGAVHRFRISDGLTLWSTADYDIGADARPVYLSGPHAVVVATESGVAQFPL